MAPRSPTVAISDLARTEVALINTGIRSRATKGKVTNIVAKTMPCTEKSTGKPLANIEAPRAECSPNSSTKQRPASTGDTENGRSNSLIWNALPRKSNFAIGQPAAMY
jgi:hypothetical protein